MPSIPTHLACLSSGHLINFTIKTKSSIISTNSFPLVLVLLFKPVICTLFINLEILLIYPLQHCSSSSTHQEHTQRVKPLRPDYAWSSLYVRVYSFNTSSHQIPVHVLRTPQFNLAPTRVRLQRHKRMPAGDMGWARHGMALHGLCIECLARLCRGSSYCTS